MELRVKVKLCTGNASELKDLVKVIEETAKEYSCDCTLLEVELTDS